MKKVIEKLLSIMILIISILLLTAAIYLLIR